MPSTASSTIVAEVIPGNEPSPSETGFVDCNIAIAVDVSGSTYSRVLDAERLTIYNIWKQLSPHTRNRARVVPWSDSTENVVEVSQITSLYSRGGTDPRSFLKFAPSRKVLQDSSLWFLFTDGKIDESYVEKFAHQIAQCGLHGKACVIVIFGVTTQPPASCDISVGVSVFAVSPHVAFLYYSLNEKKYYAIQTKGIFATLLPATVKQPILDDRTSWSDLPEIFLEDLHRLKIPTSKKLDKDEIVLQNGSVVNIKSLLNNEVQDPELIAEILEHEDNILSLAVTSNTRGDKEDLLEWINGQQCAPLDYTSAPRKDVGGVAELFEELLNNDSYDQAILSSKIRTAHENNGSNLEQKVSGSRRKSYTARLSCREYCRKPSTTAATITPTSRTIVLPAHEPDDFALYTPGYVRDRAKDGNFEGVCELCGQTDVVLAIMFRKLSTETHTPGFPLPKSRSKLAFPLAMGNFPETDVVSSLVYCESCAYSFVNCGISPNREKIVASLPLVSVSMNEKAWLKALDMALEGRFAESDLLLTFFAILSTIIQRESTDMEQIKNPRLFTAALQWLCNNLIQNAQAPSTLSPSFAGKKTGSQSQPLKLVLRNSFREARQARMDRRNSGLHQYPIEGFVVMLHASRSRSTTQDDRNLVFQRFLYHLTEEYHQYSAANSRVAASTALRGILFQSANSGNGGSESTSPPAESVSAADEAGPPQTPIMSISIDALLTTPLLKPYSRGVFQNLGLLFTWLESSTGHATAAFLHGLAQVPISDRLDVLNHFHKVLRLDAMSDALLKAPDAVDAAAVRRVVDAAGAGPGAKNGSASDAPRTSGSGGQAGERTAWLAKGSRDADDVAMTG